MNKYFIRFRYDGIEFSRIEDLLYEDLTIEYIKEKIVKNSIGKFPNSKNIDIIIINKL